jgi:hypothetical protein
MVLYGLSIIFRLIVSIALVPFAIFLLTVYVLWNSFFGIMRFEKSDFFIVAQGIIDFMRLRDNEFYDKHNLSWFKYFNDRIYRRFWLVAIILLCFFYFAQCNFMVSSGNLKQFLLMFLPFLIFFFIALLVLAKPEFNESKGGEGFKTDYHEPVSPTPEPVSQTPELPLEPVSQTPELPLEPVSQTPAPVETPAIVETPKPVIETPATFVEPVSQQTSELPFESVSQQTPEPVVLPQPETE